MRRLINIQKISLLYCALLMSMASCMGQGAKKHHMENSTKQMDQTNEHAENPYYSRTDTSVLQVSNEAWEKILPPELYAVAREQGTQAPFKGKYWNSDQKGTYYCAVCGNRLFDSDAKFASSCGWPSFFEAARKDAVIYKEDYSHGMHRIEVECARCHSHLGHIFDDGPAPTHKRYCMNSISLDFEPHN